MEKLTFVGIGRLGLCSSLVFEKAGFDVLGVDIFENYVKALNNKQYTSHEPYVVDYLKNAKNFRATTNLKEGLEFSDNIFIVVQTPNGGGLNFYDHSILSNLLVKINNLKVQNKNLIVCCTTMPEYLKNVGRHLIRDCKNTTINYNPEFICQGNIIKDFENPDMILIGQETEQSGAKIQSLYEKLFINNQRKPRYCRLSNTEAELVKISINGFITTKLSYANMISDLCDELNGDKKKVLRAIGSDSRIGNKYFNPGYSFGGPCFPRDTSALQIVLEKRGISSVLIKGTKAYNDAHIKYQANQIYKECQYKMISNYVIEDICYKENSVIPIIEESAKLKIGMALLKMGLKVTIKDVPHMIIEVRKEYGCLFEYIEK